MKLIKLETKGFKSFADLTSLRFDGGIVGIVGPNGSGKSNINDAIKWVLGETSVKSLRGDSMEDVIFAGSKTVKALDQAFVSLTFDNSDQAVSLRHKIFTITRAIKRGGGSKYFINGETARLKDIKEIAMESGISKSSLAIISQGTVSDISQASPDQRRGIFEEAAGISKYKNRKNEALRKLEKTSEAFEKIKTVVNELERQLVPLKKQADKARVYLDKKKELKDVEIGLIVEDITFYSQKLQELNSDLENVLATKDDLNHRIDKASDLMESKTSYKLSLENEIMDLNAKFQDISEKLRNIEVSDSQLSAKRKMIIDGSISSTNDAKIAAMKAELDVLRSKVHQYNLWEEKAKIEIDEKRSYISDVQANISSFNIDVEKSKSDLLRVKTRVLVLKEYQSKKTNLFSGTKAIVENSSIFPGFHGIVSNLFDVQTDYRTAIESILNNALQNIVVARSEDAVKCVNFLKKNNAGRATFIPLASISPKGIRQEHIQVMNSLEGFVGIAHELVDVKPQFEILKKFMLGNIIIAQNIQFANEISKKLDKRYMVVSLDGDVIRVGGVISGGTKSRTKSMLGVEDQIMALESNIPPLEADIQSKTRQLNQLSNSINEDHAFIAELNIETAKIREKRSIVNTQFSTLKNEYEALTQTTLEFNDEVKSIDSIQTLDAEKSSIQALLKAKRNTVIDHNNVLARITIEKTELEKSIRKLMDDSSEKMSEKNQAEYILNSSKERLSEEYEITIESASEKYSLKIDREAARTIVSGLRSDIRELGNVNIDSIQDYDEVHARHERIDASREELFNAQQTILSAIDKMDEIIIARLSQTVLDVNKEMDIIFKTMFGGGFAEVKFIDPNNPLETGIDVIAQPPGKTVKNLKLFSGGEKALVAISLLFAILKSKPLPLCILDEVEAALDDANVIRFADYLQELKADTQFLVVTHRVGTMSRVDHLFGATMQQRGVTSMFTVNLKKANELIK
ncbi:AAA family ATPase [Candidatus Mycoplasma mahonii]|uniref:AAA family ATPase n=1 Tax=Candidatus Mycoplasma mahonii TaxID=3004105 RepID=UPI0026ED226D|nr:AAA family ATPase [Candidatus Mycoplasma mahonii]WKX02727.1 AAA family ATPase [Candidatus Mycoplasma mahonii]